LDVPASFTHYLHSNPPTGLIILSASLWPLVYRLNITREWKFPYQQQVVTIEHSRIAHGVIQGRSVLLARAVHTGDVKTAISSGMFVLDIAREVDVSRCVLIGTADVEPPETADFGMVTDHVNLFGSNPLIYEDQRNTASRFPDMTDVYSDEMQEQLVGSVRSISSQKILQGVLVGVEERARLNPAQLAALKRVGRCFFCPDLVYEAIAAHGSGMELGCVLHLRAAPELSISSDMAAALMQLLSDIAEGIFS